jgi:steroid delta-isomerase-like uncharacterized protein
MTKEERNMEVVRRAIQALNDRDVDGFLSSFTEDGTSHEVFFPEPLNLEEFRPFLEEWLNAYPDAKIETQNMVAEGDKVAVENIVSGTFENDLSGNKATGKFYQAREGVFFDLSDGKIKAERIYLDQKHIEEQLGIT